MEFMDCGKIWNDSCVDYVCAMHAKLPLNIILELQLGQERPVYFPKPVARENFSCR